MKPASTRAAVCCLINALHAAAAACGLDTSGLGDGSASGMPVTATASGSSSGPAPSDSDPTSGQTSGQSTSPASTTAASADTTTTAASADADTTTPADTSESTTSTCVPEPWYPDDDGDGFGDPGGETVACDPPPDHVADAGDCNDADPDASPDADELCNGQDDDCDGVTDEGSAQNAACNGCSFLLSADGSRWFAVCSGATDWDGALPLCQGTFGPAAQLARIDAAADQAGLLVLAAGTDHWISLNDLVLEGVFRWHDNSVAYMDGAPVGYDGWRPGQPVQGDGERCGELDAGGWADAGCAQSQPRICEHPS